MLGSGCSLDVTTDRSSAGACASSKDVGSFALHSRHGAFRLSPKLPRAGTELFVQPQPPFAIVRTPSLGRRRPGFRRHPRSIGQVHPRTPAVCRHRVDSNRVSRVRCPNK